MRAVLVPVKSFSQAKARLSTHLNAAERHRLARSLAGRVLDAALGCPRFVVCDDHEVKTWATDAGIGVIWTPGLGLSGAVNAGVDHLGVLGFDYVVVAHADLPLVSPLAAFGEPGTVSLAPDRRLDGTNVAAVPTTAGFTFAYGPGSFARHHAEATRLGLECRIVYEWPLAFDVDLPEDLALVQDLALPETAPRAAQTNPDTNAIPAEGAAHFSAAVAAKLRSSDPSSA